MPAIYSEEIPMTLHIAFVGTDGILLASDRQINRTTNGVTLPHQGDKVLFDEARTREALSNHRF